jgi:hypothetical protein
MISVMDTLGMLPHQDIIVSKNGARREARKREKPSTASEMLVSPHALLRHEVARTPQFCSPLIFHTVGNGSLAFSSLIQGQDIQHPNDPGSFQIKNTLPLHGARDPYGGLWCSS